MHQNMAVSIEEVAGTETQSMRNVKYSIKKK